MVDCLTSQPLPFNGRTACSPRAVHSRKYSSISPSSSSPTEYLRLSHEPSSSISSRHSRTHQEHALWLHLLTCLLSHSRQQAFAPAPSSTRALSSIKRHSPSTASPATESSAAVIRPYLSSINRSDPFPYRIYKQNTMPPKRAPGVPNAGFHMNTRSRAAKSTPDSSSPDTTATASPPSSSADNVQSSDPASSPTSLDIPSMNLRKRKATDVIDGPQARQKPKKAAAPPKEPEDADNDTSDESRSPRKPTRGGRGRGRGGFGAGGRKSNKQKGKNGGAGRDSPDPPIRRGPLSTDDRVEISMLKNRQHELKKFFSAVGVQQIEILDQLTTKGLSKLARKPKAHKHVPEYDEVTEALDALMKRAQDDARKRYAIQVQHEKERMQHEKAIIEQQYRTRVSEAKQEHLEGAQGDIILFERAYRAAHDDTHTETGSDIDNFPRYHELPEPNAGPRGYDSRKIMDEKPFMKALETYDDQARQQVLEEDVIHPLLKQMEQRNNEWRGMQTMTMEALLAQAAKELESMGEDFVPPPPPPPPPAQQQQQPPPAQIVEQRSSYALSALADVAEHVAWENAERAYNYLPPPPPPPPPSDSYPRPALDFPPVQAPRLAPYLRPASRTLKPAINGQVPAGASGSVAPPTLAPRRTRSASERLRQNPTPPPRTTPSGPGQPIAPAPPKPVTRSSLGTQIFRASRLGSQSGPSPIQSSGPQQFIFQTPQQPLQHQTAPGPSPTPQYGPPGSGVGAAPVGQQTKIPMTFVNQTIASRNAAAAGGSPVGMGTGGSLATANVKGGQRMLLPKMQQ